VACACTFCNKDKIWGVCSNASNEFVTFGSPPPTVAASVPANAEAPLFAGGAADDEDVDIARLGESRSPSRPPP